MTSPLGNLAFSPHDYAEDTDFERLVLDRLGTHRVRVAEPTSINDARGKPSGSGNIIVKAGAAVTGMQAREELAQSLRPLGFGAAYKVLDQLIENVLRANGVPARTFAQKSAALAQRPAFLPPPFDFAPDAWDRLVALYGAFKEARHAVTHRRALASVAGDLEIYDDQRQLIDTLSSGEIQSFAAAVHAAAELVIDADSNNRRLNIVAWHLNALQARHGMALMQAADPNAHRRLLQMDLVELEDGRLRFDVPRAMEVVEGQTLSVWDVELHAGNRVYVGHWEDVPDDQAPLDFHPASPPHWLSEEVPR